MIIAVDGMGGDNSPDIVVEGCVKAVNENKDLDIVITGPEDIINEKLKNYTYDTTKIKIVDAKEVIGFNEHPVMAIRRKKDSSLRKAIELVKMGDAHAVVSAGSTGAFMAGALFVLGRIDGVDRPALAPVMPGAKNKFMVVDAGANAECKPFNLVQFAIMGKIYMEKVLNFENAKVGLVNIGTEEEKGNELTKATYPLLKQADLNFIGNIEPREIAKGEVQVIVADGFVGNTVLKMFEGVALTVLSELKERMLSSTRGKIGALILKPVFSAFKKKYDYKETGGAPFLGVNGICVKAHGSSDARAMKNAITQCISLYNNNVIENISKEIKNSLNIK